MYVQYKKDKDIDAKYVCMYVCTYVCIRGGDRIEAAILFDFLTPLMRLTAAKTASPCLPRKPLILLPEA